MHARLHFMRVVSFLIHPPGRLTGQAEREALKT